MVGQRLLVATDPAACCIPRAGQALYFIYYVIAVCHFSVVPFVCNTYISQHKTCDIWQDFLWLRTLCQCAPFS